MPDTEGVTRLEETTIEVVATVEGPADLVVGATEAGTVVEPAAMDLVASPVLVAEVTASPVPDPDPVPISVRTVSITCIYKTIKDQEFELSVDSLHTCNEASQQLTTPLQISTSGITTEDPPAVTAPFCTLMASWLPPRVESEPVEMRSEYSGRPGTMWLRRIALAWAIGRSSKGVPVLSKNF